MQPGQVIQPQSNNVPDEAEEKIPELSPVKRSMTSESSGTKEMNTNAGSTVNPVAERTDEKTPEVQPKTDQKAVEPSQVVSSELKDEFASAKKEQPPKSKVDLQAEKPEEEPPERLSNQKNNDSIEIKEPEQPKPYNNQAEAVQELTSTFTTDTSESTSSQTIDVSKGINTTPEIQAQEDTVKEEIIDRTPLISWQASEYVQPTRSLLWYAALGIISAGVLLYFIVVLHAWLSAVVLLLTAIAIIVYAHRTPRTLEYSLSTTGIMLGDKYYPYSQFHSFTVLPIHGQLNIELDPLRRFMPRISLPIDQQNLETILNVLNPILPKSDRKPDPIDRLTHYLKF